MELKGKKVNFLGDSITVGGGTECAERDGYVAVLARELELECARNYGMGATRIARRLTPEPHGWDGPAFVDRYTGMDDDADLVVVFGGTNDYGLSDAPFGEMSDRVADTFCGACHLLFQGLIEKYPATPIVVLTPLQRWGCNDSNHTGKSLKGYVDAIIEIAGYYSLPVLDLYRTAGMHADIQVQRELYFMDGLHPNNTGAKKLADCVAAFLKTL